MSKPAKSTSPPATITAKGRAAFRRALWQTIFYINYGWIGFTVTIIGLVSFLIAGWWIGSTSGKMQPALLAAVFVWFLLYATWRLFISQSLDLLEDNTIEKCIKYFKSKPEIYTNAVLVNIRSRAISTKADYQSRALIPGILVARTVANIKVASPASSDLAKAVTGDENGH